MVHGDEQQGKWVVPNPQIPRSFGLMNIIFGAIMVLLLAMGYGVWLSLQTDLQQAVSESDQRAAREAEGRARRRRSPS